MSISKGLRTLAQCYEDDKGRLPSYHKGLVTALTPLGIEDTSSVASAIMTEARGMYIPLELSSQEDEEHMMLKVKGCMQEIISDSYNGDIDDIYHKAIDDVIDVLNQ